MAFNFIYEVLIKEQHLDMFGHVNNAIYLQLFEEARWDFITQRGYGLNKILECRKGPVVLEAHLKFLKEIKLREVVSITFKPLEELTPATRISKMNQKMIKANGDIACELNISFGFFDLNERRLIRPTPDWISIFI